MLANSFAHAIYNGRTTHEICIHPGMVTGYSPGEYTNKHKPEEYIKDNIESGIRNATIAKILYLSKSIEQFVIYRPEFQSDITSVALDVTLNGTEMAVLAFL